MDEYERLKTAADKEKTTEAYKHLIDFVKKSQELFYDRLTRESIVRRLQKAKENEELHDQSEELLQKAKEIEQEVANIVSKNTEFLGKGSYGCVVKPALPNRIDHAWKTYPQNVSKLFLDQEDAENAIEKASTWVRKTGNAGQAMYKYERKIRSEELPKHIQTKCGIPSGENLHVARMPNMGVSFADIAPFLSQIRMIPLPTLLQQIGKVFKQIQLMHNEGYLHGDIRSPNIMIDPSEGTITLIDFDWFYKKDEFFDQYEQGFGSYYNPPESLMKPALIKYLRNKTLPEVNIQQVETYVRHSKAPRERIGVPYTVETVVTANVENFELLKHVDNIDHYYEILFETFDSYSASLAFLDFVSILYADSNETTVNKLYEIFLKATALTMESRLSLDDCVKKLEELPKQGGTRKHKRQPSRWKKNTKKSKISKKTRA